MQQLIRDANLQAPAMTVLVRKRRKEKIKKKGNKRKYGEKNMEKKIWKIRKNIKQKLGEARNLQRLQIDKLVGSWHSESVDE